ncbi:MAG: hypothetical protein ACKVTZ_06090 [Bacteroidia bacterium]
MNRNSFSVFSLIFLVSSFFAFKMNKTTFDSNRIVFATKTASEVVKNPMLANGYRIKGSNATVYLVFGGKKRPIAGAEIYNRLFKNWDNIVRMSDSEVNAIPTGRNITEPTFCAKFKDGGIYFCDNAYGSMRCICNMETINEVYCFKYEDWGSEDKFSFIENKGWDYDRTKLCNRE